MQAYMTIRTVGLRGYVHSYITATLFVFFSLTWHTGKPLGVGGKISATPGAIL